MVFYLYKKALASRINVGTFKLLSALLPLLFWKVLRWQAIFRKVLFWKVLFWKGIVWKGIVFTRLARVLCSAIVSMNMNCFKVSRRNLGTFHGYQFAIIIGLFLATFPSYAQSKNDKLHHIYVPRHDAATALNLLAEQANVTLLFPYEQAHQVMAKPVAGRYTLMQALALMLDGTGFTGQLSPDGMLNITAIKPSLNTAISDSSHDEIIKKSPEDQAVNKAVEVITINGIRSSLVKSINNKRFSNDVIDTIDAEDVGKFPDTNIAESLQRIAGISIDRSGGEGQFITIRGLGPEFNTVLLNGRKIASTTGGRAFSLDTLASEINSSISAYKSSNAQLIEGGLGGTVDIQTARPFDYDDFNSTLSIKGLYSDSSNSVDPQYSFLVSNSFLDDSLAILAAFNHQERSQTNTSVRNFVNNTGDLLIEQGPFWQEMPAEYIDKNTLTQVTSPQSLDRDVMDEFRERSGANIVVQYQPHNDLLLTFDALYSKFNVSASGYSANNWLWYPTDIELDSSRTAVWLQHGASGFATAYRERERPTETSVVGANIDWSFTENFNINVDVFSSKAVNENIGLNKDIIVEMISEEYVEYDYRQGGDYPLLIQPQHTIASLQNSHLLLPKRVESRGLDVDANNVGFKADFTWHYDGEHLNSIRFGSHFNHNNKQNDFYAIAPEVSSLYADNSNAAQFYIPEQYVSVGQLKGGWHGITDSVHKIDIDNYLQWLQNPETVALLEESSPNLSAGEGQAILTDNDYFKPNKVASSYQIDEKILAFYLQANAEFSLASKPLTIVAGLRYSQTQLHSQGIEHLLLDIQAPLLGNDTLGDEIAESEQPEGEALLTPVYVPSPQDNMTKITHDYHAWLPSLNTTLHLNKNLLLRSALSKTLARPALDDLSPWIAINSENLTPESRVATAANPTLTPYIATNIDISLEWYYSPASMFSMAGFGKRIKDWIVLSSATETLSLESSDYADFDITRPRNEHDVDIYGIELNWIHSFDNGFGFQTNATFVNSNKDLSQASAGQSTFAIEGLSDSANVVVFYEKKAWQVRLAYNIREEFLQHRFWQNGSEPMYVGSYKQLDASASYKVNTDFTLFFEGLNLLDENTHKYGYQKSQFLEFSETEPRYALGIRASF